MFFSHSAAQLSDDDLILWARYANLLFAILNDYSIQSYFYLGTTEVQGTYIVKWQQGGEVSLPSTNAAASSDLAGAGVQLTVIAPTV